jgi:RHS repeat-associated protein
VPNYYGYDGHGSVRYLMDATGAVTDTYDYDAFGNLISSTGTTPNNYLFAGEQFDPALGIYYNRARYYDERQGRFWIADAFEGDPGSPTSLHKYLYVSADPGNRVDPSGNEETTEVGQVGAGAVNAVLEGIEWATELAKPIALWRRVAAVLTAAALIAASIAVSLGTGGSGTDLENPSDNQEVDIPVYRDTKGTNPGEFSFTPPTYPETDIREISLLEIPTRDKKFVVPFRVRFRLPKTPFSTVGGIVDPELAQLNLQVHYSPKTTPGHWSLLGNLYNTPEEQMSIKKALADFAKTHAQPAH